MQAAKHNNDDKPHPTGSPRRKRRRLLDILDDFIPASRYEPCGPSRAEVIRNARQQERDRIAGRQGF